MYNEAYTEYDKLVYEKELKDFLPDEFIDFHTHVDKKGLEPYGSHNGGSFGGSHGGHFGGHHQHGPFFRGPRRRTVFYGGGGCFSIVFIFIFIIFSALFFLMPNGAVIDFSDGVTIQEDIYDEATMQDYANVKYQKYFGNTSATEDNILLVMLTNEACDGYYTIAWVGDNVDYSINEMFGEYTEYGDALYNNVDEYFAY